MIAGVADTHTALWYLYDDARLSVTAGEFIDQAAASGLQIAISSITLAEIDAMRKVSRSDVPDMPDRIIAATGVHLATPVISCDGYVRVSSVKTVW